LIVPSQKHLLRTGRRVANETLLQSTESRLIFQLAVRTVKGNHAGRVRCRHGACM